MEKILIDLFHGDLSILDKCDYPCSAYSEAYEKMERLEDELLNALPAPLKAKFTEFRDAFQKVSDLACEQDFVTGFRVGAQLTMAALI